MTTIRQENEAYIIESMKQSVNDFKWIETTEERYFEMLECLPPECMIGGGFLVGEASNHRRCKINNCVKPTFDAFRKTGKFGSGNEKFYAASESVTIPEFKVLMTIPL